MPQNPDTRSRPSRVSAGRPQMLTLGFCLKRCFCSLAPRNSQKPNANNATSRAAAVGESVSGA